MSERTRILSGLAAEVAFAVLPLLVVLMVVVYVKQSSDLFASPEWSFGAAILFGQSLVKFVSGLARVGKAAMGPVALLVSLLVVFGLVPALVVLSMTLMSFETKSHPARWLQACQVIFFVISAGMYMLMGFIGEAWGKKLDSV